MTSEELFFFIRKLRKSQRRDFIQFVSPSPNSRTEKESAYLILFKRICSLKKFNDQKMRGSEFENSNYYYKTKSVLIERIIQSLVRKESFETSIRLFLFKAVGINAFGAARNRLGEEMKEAYKSNSLEYLRYLYSLRTEIHDAFNYSIQIPDSIPEIAQLTGVLDDSAKLRQALKTLRGIGAKPVGKRRVLVEKVQANLVGIQEKKCNSYQLFKVKASIAMLKNEVYNAFILQQELVKVLGTEKTPNGVWFKEYSILINLANSVGDCDTAIKYTLLFSSIKPLNHRERDLKGYFGIGALIGVGVEQGNLEFSQMGLGELEKNIHLFSESQIATLYLESAVSFFANGLFEKSLECLKRVELIKKNNREKSAIFVDVLLAMNYYELEQLELLDIKIKKLSRISRSDQLQAYANTFSRGISKLRSTPIFNKNVDYKKIDSFLDDLDDWQAEFSNNPINLIVDVSIWLRSKRYNLSMKEIMAELNIHNFLSQSKKHG